MQLDIVTFVESYLESKRTKSAKTETEFRQELVKYGFDEEHARDLLLYLDDEWTNEQFIVSQLKYSKLNMFVGYLLAFTGIILTILSYYGFLGAGIGIVVFYGAIAGGFILGYRNQSKISKLKQDLKTRAVNWKIRFRAQRVIETD